MAEHATARHANNRPSRVAAWVGAVVLAVILVGAVALAYGALRPTAQPTQPPTPPAVTITVAPPSPSLSPSPRADGTEFYNALPSTVGAYVLVAEDANPDWLAAAAYDAYSLTYSDGSDQITLLAGQWRTAEAAQQAFGQLGGDQAWPGAAAVPTGGPTSCPEAPDPDIAALWLNRDAIFRVDAPAGGAAMFYCQMPY